MMVMTGVGRRATRWMAGLAAAACCVAGVALPAHAVDEEPISLPQTAPSQAPSPGFLPGHILNISARLDRTTGVVRKLLTVCLCGFCPGRLV